MNRFAALGHDDLLTLVREFPLAWVVSGAGDDFHTTLLPILPRLGTDGRLSGLTGHFSRSNPQVKALQVDPRANFLFRGPSGYISPSWMTDRTRAPTWNYASAQISGVLQFHEDAAWTRAHMDELAGVLEAGRPKQWSVSDMGERYQSLSRGVIGFEVEITGIREKYKLGQDERDDVFHDIVLAMGNDGDPVLLEWMKRYNPGRN